MKSWWLCRADVSGGTPANVMLQRGPFGRKKITNLKGEPGIRRVFIPRPEDYLDKLGFV